MDQSLYNQQISLTELCDVSQGKELRAHSPSILLRFCKLWIKGCSVLTCHGMQ